MDVPQHVRHPAQKGHQRKSKGRPQPGPAPLFDDTSNPGGMPGGGGMYGQQPPPNQGYAGGQFINDPMASMAMQYGASLADHGKDVMEKQVERFVSVSNLKYYFAVDTTYVGKKLAILLFPFGHTAKFHWRKAVHDVCKCCRHPPSVEWTIQYNQDEPVAPRFEVNAPDLYIPVMAFVTYILLAGVCLGRQNRFSPEMLGMQASSAMAWFVVEVLAVLLTMYITNIHTALRKLDLIAFCGYKYVGMIACLLANILFSSGGYHLAVLYTSIAIVFFLVRNLKLIILPESPNDGFGHGNKRRLYILLFISLIQPLFVYWLTYHLTGVYVPEKTGKIF